LPELGDFAISATDSLLAFELAPLIEPTPAPEEPSTARKFRIDAAHPAVPNPHHTATDPSWSTRSASGIDSKTDVAPIALAPSPHDLDLLPLEPESEFAAEPDPEPREYALADAIEPAAQQQQSPLPRAEPTKPCVPLWEVDAFIWPATCEKLISDERSYFLQAGGKLLAACKDGLKTLAITGSRRGEGRTTLALCLARCAAKSGLNVAVVDADFARPQLASQVGLEVAYGWQDAALGKIPLAEAAVKSVADRITLLPLEVSTAGAALSLSDPRVTATLRAAAATFELVIVDLGPLAGGSEPLFPREEACPFDACIVVRDLRYATATESQAVGDRLYVAGVAAVGIAENFVQQEA
jgi:Mrp family chromosome partitioning ATPase